MLSAKMVGNMIELNRPTATTEYSDTWPEPSMVRPSSTTLAIANIVSSRRGENRVMIAEPAKRPIIASVQYAET
ncbi:hypothetical protein D9M71_816510 [compost metagenome]